MNEWDACAHSHMPTTARESPRLTVQEGKCVHRKVGSDWLESHTEQAGEHTARIVACCIHFVHLMGTMSPGPQLV